MPLKRRIGYNYSGDADDELEGAQQNVQHMQIQDE
jgi:hypothetical protein